MQQGLLLFAHGARDPNWAQPFEATLDAIRESAAERDLPLLVQLAFLEFMQPDLLKAASRLVKSGCVRVDIVPLFLGAGGHVRKDLPALVETLRSSHPEVEWIMRPAVGETPDVIAAMAAASLAWAGAAAPGVDSAKADQ